MLRTEHYLYFNIIIIIIYMSICLSRLITSVWEERANFFLLSITRNDVVSVGRGFLFLLVPGICCVISLLCVDIVNSFSF